MPARAWTATQFAVLGALMDDPGAAAVIERAHVDSRGRLAVKLKNAAPDSARDLVAATAREDGIEPVFAPAKVVPIEAGRKARKATAAASIENQRERGEAIEAAIAEAVAADRLQADTARPLVAAIEYHEDGALRVPSEHVRAAIVELCPSAAAWVEVTAGEAAPAKIRKAAKPASTAYERRKQAATLAIARGEAVNAAGQHFEAEGLLLHLGGQWYRGWEGNRRHWRRISDDEVRGRFRDRLGRELLAFEGLDGGTVPGSHAEGELRKRMQTALLPPALADGKVSAEEQRTAGWNLDRGEPLDGVAFRDVRISLRPDGTIESERREPRGLRAEGLSVRLPGRRARRRGSGTARGVGAVLLADLAGMPGCRGPRTAARGVHRHDAATGRPPAARSVAPRRRPVR